MAVLAWFGVGALVFLTVCLVAGAVKADRPRGWEWLHPPEDDDGVSILKDDDPDGTCTR